ncbi:reverse transcriptase-like protein [Arabidopsis thaliana]|uniref:Reverse transcriptase-like protein n=1 Tax=Arabidopsis thaliana TaxID=3702 RepID=A0A1P8AY32_ARATH|nr:reverse transcriptase-like protein [Arabidopsis thaliana]ANM61566.1 reverse transcriptase-like protein [Arabidopsis thaliana]|eukprot:NP_001323774.1 reverse transcriptase-like protein [Arabidopsis thaliana]
MVLVSLLQSPAQRFDLFNWVTEIKLWERRFEGVEYNWVPRTANKAADQLARNQRLSTIDFFYHHLIPPCIATALYVDSVNQ